MQLGSFAPEIHREDPIVCRLWATRLRQGYGALAPAPKAFGAGAGDEARTRDVHLGKVVLYQLSYTRSFERDNNVQPTAPRNLLIALGSAKSLNPNRTFTASYDQTLYEKTLPPLHVLARVVWQLVSTGPDRKCSC